MADPGFEIIGQILTLNGLTPVLSDDDYKNPIVIMDADSVGSGADEFDAGVAAGTITATVGGANSGELLPGQIGNRSFGAVQIIPQAPGNFPITTIVDEISLSIGRVTSGQGQVEIGIFRKRGSAPPLLTTNPLTFETNVAVDIQFQVDIVFQSEDVLFARVIQSDQNVMVSIDMGANIYGPAPA